MGVEARRSTWATLLRDERSSRHALWYISDSIAPSLLPMVDKSIVVTVGLVRIEDFFSCSLFFPFCFGIFDQFGRDGRWEAGR